MSTQENKAIVQRFIEEVRNRGNVAAVDELLAPNYVAHFGHPTDSPGPEKYRRLSHEEFKQYVSQKRSAFPDLQHRIELQVAEGDLVVTRLIAGGTHKGEYHGLTFKGIPPTGKQVTWSSTEIFRLADGKIVEHWINQDVVGRLRQMGALPTPGQASESPL